VTKRLVIPEQQKYNDFISEILSTQLFESGSELRLRLVEKFGVSDANARQIVARAAATKDIKSSRPYTFGHGQFIYLLQKQGISVEMIMSICRRKRPPLYRLLHVMKANNGIISYYEGLKITASPDVGSSTKVNTLQDMIKILVKLELVYEKKDVNGINFIIFRKDFDEGAEARDKALMAEHFNKMVIDSSLMPDIIRWLVKSNLIDNVNAIYRNKKTPSLGAKQNGLYWDAYSYSRATGINPIAGGKADTVEKQTLVVLDVVLSDTYSQQDLDGFLARVQINLNSVKKGVRKVMPIVVYQSCSEEVLGKIKKLGFLAFDVGSIFGTRIYTILSKLKEVNDSLVADDNIEKSVKAVLKAIKSAGQEDALRDLRGLMFELLMFPVLKEVFGSANYLRGKTYSVTHPDQTKEGYEYDYIFDSSHPQEIVVIELKGYNSDVSIALGDKNKKATLKWFFERTLPFAKNQYKKELAAGKKFKGVYITTANFWQDGKDYLADLNKGTLKSAKMNVSYDRKALLELLKINEYLQEIKIIEKYYSRER
jgi:hypothetical protein